MALHETIRTLPGRLPGVKAARCLALLTLTLLACGGGTTLQPAGGPAGGALAQELPGVRVTVASGAWTFRPRSLPEHVLPFLVAARNTGSQPVALTRADFLLLDEANRQYGPLAPTEVLALLGGGSPSGIAVSPSIGIGGSTGGGGSIFGGGLGISLGSGYGGPDTRDVIPRAFPEGPIHPGAEVQGFLYFPQPTAPYQTLRLVVAPREIPGHPRAEFVFQKTP